MDTDDIYDELKGFFPPEYDLSPEELEKEIKSEPKPTVKKPQHVKPAAAPKPTAAPKPAAQRPQSVPAVRVEPKAEHAEAAAEHIEKQEPKPEKTPENAPYKIISEPIVAPEPEPEPEIITTDDTIPDFEQVDWEVPKAEPVTDNELLNKYKSLDDLFDIMDENDEDEGETISDNSEPEQYSAPEQPEITAEPETPAFSDFQPEAEADDLTKADDILTNTDEFMPEEHESASQQANTGDTPRARLNWFFDFLEVFTICMACIILFFSFIARLTRVEGQSMDDTLADSQYLIVTKLFYTPTRGDIVVLQNTSLSIEKLKEPLVKRVIAVGGDTVDITDNGVVTITDSNGKETVLQEDYTKKEVYFRGAHHCTVPEGMVFVMGDNRNNSTDSRDPRVGLVDERCIFGHALFRVLPFDKATVFENPYGN